MASAAGGILALSVSHSLDRFPLLPLMQHLPPARGKSFLKVGAFGSPCKVYHYAKASPFDRLPRPGEVARSARRGTRWHGASRDGEGEPAEKKNIFRLFPENATFLQKKLQFFLEKGRFPIDSLVIIGM